MENCDALFNRKNRPEKVLTFFWLHKKSDFCTVGYAHTKGSGLNQ